MTSLEQLKEHTTVVADTGEFELIRNFRPQDATTNPSLILAAFGKAEYAALTADAIAYAKKLGGGPAAELENALDRLSVNFGIEILKVVPGRVSTELDARLSFDTARTLERARKLAAMYKDAGVDVNRVLFKIASTWEGLAAARQLEAEGLHCNLTLLFSLAQAAVAAEAGVTLISPFAGRITDFYKAKEPERTFAPADDPGVVSVQRIFHYYKKFGYKTLVMGASFRTVEQVKELCGCDLLTISPSLLEKLQASTDSVPLKLDAKASAGMEIARLETDELSFRWLMNEDEMATAKLSEGIRRFAADTEKLATEIRKRL